jgi:formylglycine-generating enzyme
LIGLGQKQTQGKAFMKNTILRAGWGFWLGVSFFLIQSLHAQTAPKLSIHMHYEYVGITITGTVNTAYSLQAAINLPETNGWVALTNVVLPTSPWVYIDYAMPRLSQRFYRVVHTNPPPNNMVLIPAGEFTMGDTFNEYSDALPTHTVYVSAFYMDKYEVTKALWDEVYTWAIQHGYSFDNSGYGKAANHPVVEVNWYDVVKWCNARSEKENRIPAYYTSAALTTVYRSGRVDIQNDWVKWNAGYRLPTEAEREKAARGGASGHRFPWTNVDTITHDQANYRSDSGFSYDISLTRGYHPSYQSGGEPYTSPVGSFAANGYGLYDMAGNVLEWCWDWYGHYSSSSQTDPRGPSSAGFPCRMIRDGSWFAWAANCKVTYRFWWSPSYANSEPYGQPGGGFRTVLSPDQ